MVAPQRETRRKEQREEMIPNREREKEKILMRIQRPHNTSPLKPANSSLLKSN